MTQTDLANRAGLNVALRKESVDRNVFLTLTVRNVSMSLSARRAWIEMVVPSGCWLPDHSSLSARRAWIEISRHLVGVYFGLSLSARRAWIEIEEQIEQETAPESLSARRAWIEILFVCPFLKNY